MNAAKILHTYLTQELEHPVPFAGDIVHLEYPPKENSVGVTVDTRSNFIATFTITVPASELEPTIENAKLAIVRNLGFNAKDPASIDAARKKLGDKAFEEHTENMVRLAFLSTAMMRTGVFAFLSPEILPSKPIKLGEDYIFQAQMTLRPRSGLTSTKAPAIKKPAKPEITNQAINERMNQMIGGNVPWDMVSSDKSESVEKLRSQMRDLISAENESQWHEEVVNLCLDEMVKRLTEEVPYKHIELLRDNMANSYASNLVSNGVDWDAYIASPGFNLNDFKQQMTMNAISALNRGMALDALAEALKIKLTEDDILGAAGQVAPGHEAEAIQGMLQTGQLPQLCEVTKRIKAGDWLVRNCKDA